MYIDDIETPDPEDVKTLRKELGLTQTQAGELIYKSLRTIQQWEAGERKIDMSSWELFQIKAVLTSRDLDLRKVFGRKRKNKISETALLIASLNERSSSTST